MSVNPPPQHFERPKPLIEKNLDHHSLVYAYLHQERKLTLQTLRDYRIQAQGRDIVFPYYRDNELIYIKYLSIDRPHGKKTITSDAKLRTLLVWLASS